MSNEETPVAEPEKVGPLGAVAQSSDLRLALLASFRRAIDDARAATAMTSVDAGVHDCRKALRRARAIVRLVANTLGRDDRRDLRRALRDARRLLSPSRDVAVLPGALAALDVGEEAHAAAVATVAAARATATPAEETRKLVAEAVAKVVPLADVMAAALPAALEWDDVADGLADTYRAGRRAMKKARRSHGAFHAVKRRAKELALQLELLAGAPDGKVDALGRRLSDLADELGDTVDEIMLRNYLAEHGADAAVLEAIDGQLDRRMATGRKSARALFDRRARRFTKKVQRAMRKDVAAVAPQPAN
jgi:CHAD domain-containing protein